MIVGARSILITAPLATLLGTVLGTAIGLVTGYYRGLVDEVTMRVVDAMLAVPVIILALLAIVSLGPSRVTLILVIGIVFSMIIAKTVRAAVLSERELDYVQAARLRNERGPYIMVAEILPNVMGPVIVEFTVRLGYAIFTIATLAFLGFGADPSVPDWGRDISDQLPVHQRRRLVGGPLSLPGHRHPDHRHQPHRRRSREDVRAMNRPAIELRDLEVAYRVRGVDRQVLRGVSLVVEEGESYGLVGESGCGKSTTAYAIMRYLPRNGRVTSGSISVNGQDLLGMSQAEVRRLRATTLSIVYQDPASALNPSLRVGDQVAESFRLIGTATGESDERAREMLARVQISDPGRVMRRYPHQLSGGMQQRIVIAMALASNPTLLILDEPTTGLDATVEAEVLDLVAGLRSELGTSVLFISHNLGVIRRMCERVGVLYAGRLVEEGTAEQVLSDPRHPYTVGLLRCLPRGGARKDRERLDTIPGFLPQLGADLPGCVFAPRCGLAREICHAEDPPFHTDRRWALEPLSLPRGGGAAPAHRGGSCRTDRPDDRRRRPGRHDRAREQDLPPGGKPRPRARGRRPGDQAGRDARPRRRVGQRQDDPCPAAPGPHVP